MGIWLTHYLTSKSLGAMNTAPAQSRHSYLELPGGIGPPYPAAVKQARTSLAFMGANRPRSPWNRTEGPIALAAPGTLQPNPNPV